GLPRLFISRLRWNFKSAETGGIEVPHAFTKAPRCTNEQRFRRVQEADRGLGVRPRRRETDGESFDSLQAAVRARLPDRRNRFRDRPSMRSGYQKGKNTLVILMKVTSVRVLTANESIWPPPTIHIAPAGEAIPN